MSLDIAREVTAALAEAESVQATGWKWRKGVVLFPETRCPYCREAVRSRAIWLVEGNSLIGQAVPRAGRPLVLDPPEHPHATPSDICMGNASDPLQALFTGLNPESVFVNMIEWLQGEYWEHSCDAMAVAEEEESDTHENEFCCESCNEWYDNDDSYSNGDYLYCQDCFYKDYFYCVNCSEAHANDSACRAFGDSYCDDCFADKFFNCDECGATYKLDNSYYSESGNGPFCEDCYDGKYFHCERCEGECSTDERYDDAKPICCDCITW